MLNGRSLILNRTEHLLPSQQSSLQFGFTKGTSILLAALVINESITEAKKLNLPLYIAFLDLQKAFDVVDHQSLKCKLFYNGINGKIWSLMEAWYFNLSSRVKWSGHISDPFPIQQGVRQAEFCQQVSTKPISMNYYSPLSVTELEPTLEQRM